MFDPSLIVDYHEGAIWCRVICPDEQQFSLELAYRKLAADGDVSRRSGGRLLQVTGPETAKPRGP